jgi:hypothetical protein
MQVSEKEQIYTQLREYHEHDTQLRTSNVKVSSLQIELEGLKEETVNTVLRFINGKSEFADVSGPLNKFKEKVDEAKSGGPADTKDKTSLLMKIGRLQEIVTLASKSHFRLKPVKAAKVR